jgi:hypothetical protein
MRGEAAWLDLLVILGGALFVLGIIVLGTWRSGFRRRKQEFVCPLEHIPVKATVLLDAKTLRWTFVERCSAFADPEAVTCSQACREEHAPLRIQRLEAVVR